MNESAMQHIPESKYCFAVNSNTVALRLRVSREDFPDKIEVVYGGKHDYARKRFSAPMQRSCEDRLFAWYTAYISLSDVRFAYVFRITEGERVSYYSEDGLTRGYDFDLSFYNCFQLAYINEADIMRPVEWMRTAVFYQIFVERFLMGDEGKDKSYINLQWGQLPTPKSFSGGDLEGIIQKLDYLKELGISAIYLTPIFKSVSNHKYDISDYYAIDEHFGDREVLKRLVDGAHARGMRIVLDAVFNHCSKDIAQFQDVIKNGKNSPYFDWFIIHGDRADCKNVNYECFASCAYMPKWNTSNRRVQKYLTDIATYWIKEYNIDGWRLDVSDEISHDFWRDLRKAVKAVKPDCVLIGENWHDANSYLHGDQYDSIMNYAFTKACLDFYCLGNFSTQQFADKLTLRAFKELDRREAPVHADGVGLYPPGDADEEVELKFRQDQHRIGDAGILHILLRGQYDVSGILIQRPVFRIVDDHGVSGDGQRGNRAERIDNGGIQIRNKDHVALFHNGIAVVGRVEANTVFHGFFRELGGGNRNVAELPVDIDDLEIDHLDSLRLDQLDDAFSGL